MLLVVALVELSCAFLYQGIFFGFGLVVFFYGLLSIVTLSSARTGCGGYHPGLILVYKGYRRPAAAFGAVIPITKSILRLQRSGSVTDMYDLLGSSNALGNSFIGPITWSRAISH